MRLWHQDLIPLLPKQQLLGQHSEICGMRGNGWGKKHSVVNYVFKYSPARLFAYHQLIMAEMIKRKVNLDTKWCDIMYRGKKCEPYAESLIVDFFKESIVFGDKVFLEHDETYLQECLDNLKGKGIIINIG